jgi:hypothetical protein
MFTLFFRKKLVKGGNQWKAECYRPIKGKTEQVNEIRRWS